ncbi:MAG: hypothetical protein DRI33_02200 [Caldiserica bacterium]|nr:MAG: hypothetical protein DRI33_02200 [Caldisericota bacterium]
MGKDGKMKIGIFYLDGVKIKKTAEELANFFRKRNIKVFINEKLRSAKPDKDSVIISLGGDGTFLKASHLGIEMNVPVLGINLGNLGFLTDVEARDVFNATDELLKGNFFIEKRAVLKGLKLGEGGKEDTFFAVNDFVLVRSIRERMMFAEIFVNGMRAGKFRSDGIVIATPTGSTAYALSLGAPIITPSASVYELVFIAPHKLSARPIIFSGEDHLSLRILSKEPVSFQRDGEEIFKLKMFDRVTFEKANRELRVVHLKKKNFFDVLNKKFGWGE